MRLYDHPASANCMKPRILLRQLGLQFEPVLELDSGDVLPESAAILLYLAEGTPFLPAAPLERARVHQWLFFEQNQVEAGAAVARFMAAVGLDKQHPEVFANRQAQGRRSLKTLSRALADGRPFVASDDYTVADIALYAYVHCAPDAGLELDLDTQAWLARVAATPGFVNDLAPIPAP